MKTTIKKLLNETHNVPPMFSSNFRDEGPEWVKLPDIDYEIIGRVLICHLIIEHYITNFLILNTRSDIGWSQARLQFSHKLSLLKGMRPFTDNDFLKGVKIVNEIRNDFSHKLSATIEKS